jgi:hypothetical protein
MKMKVLLYPFTISLFLVMAFFSDLSAYLRIKPVIKPRIIGPKNPKFRKTSPNEPGLNPACIDESKPTSSFV